MPGNTAQPFLVHVFDAGLADDRYAVEPFRARANGDIVAVADAHMPSSRRKTGQVSGTSGTTEATCESGRISRRTIILGGPNTGFLPIAHGQPA